MGLKQPFLHATPGTSGGQAVRKRYGGRGGCVQNIGIFDRFEQRELVRPLVIPAARKACGLRFFPELNNRWVGVTIG
jgi:hypothetical protein